MADAAQRKRGTSAPADGQLLTPATAVRILAGADADHPDLDPDWRP
jgi:hypothetical protein